jgi:hypothetical protein
MKMPEIRDRFYIIAAELHVLAEPHPHAETIYVLAEEIRDLADATRRRFNGRRAGVEAGPVTGSVVAAVKAIAAARPRAPFRKIGLALDIDGGRVSEILAGKHDDKLATHS